MLLFEQRELYEVSEALLYLLGDNMKNSGDHRSMQCSLSSWSRKPANQPKEGGR